MTMLIMTIIPLPSFLWQLRCSSNLSLCSSLQNQPEWENLLQHWTSVRFFPQSRWDWLFYWPSLELAAENLCTLWIHWGSVFCLCCRQLSHSSALFCTYLCCQFRRGFWIFVLKLSIYHLGLLSWILIIF